MTVTLYCVDSGLPEDVDLAIVIAGEPVTCVAEQRHAGFVVKAFDDKLLLFDLAWHNIFRQSNIESTYAYTVAGFLDQYSANAIIAFLAILHHANKGKIPYSINYEDGEYFDKATGECLKKGLGQGLTCATFVLEVLSRYGFELIDKTTWPLTEDNKEWQKGILDKLIYNTNVPCSIDDFLAQFDYIGKAPRIKPEEVVGVASYFDDVPIGFDVASSAANEVISELHRLHLDGVS